MAAQPDRPSHPVSWWTRTARLDISPHASRYLPPNRGHPSSRLVGKSLNERTKSESLE